MHFQILQSVDLALRRVSVDRFSVKFMWPITFVHSWSTSSCHLDRQHRYTIRMPLAASSNCNLDAGSLPECLRRGGVYNQKHQCHETLTQYDGIPDGHQSDFDLWWLVWEHHGSGCDKWGAPGPVAQTMRESLTNSGRCPGPDGYSTDGPQALTEIFWMYPY